jgi:hypothetical protein
MVFLNLVITYLEEKLFDLWLKNSQHPKTGPQNLDHSLNRTVSVSFLNSMVIQWSVYSYKMLQTTPEIERLFKNRPENLMVSHLVLTIRKPDKCCHFPFSND